MNPRGIFIKCLHLVLGLTWLAGSPLFVWQAWWGQRVLFSAALGTLWYLPFGTVLSLLVLIGLLKIF